MVLYCCVETCSNTSTTHKIHRFPSNKQLFEKWLERVNMKALFCMNQRKIIKSYRICEKHFHPMCHIKPPLRSRTGLKATSLPTMRLPGFHEEACVANCFLDGAVLYSGKRKLNTSIQPCAALYSSLESSDDKRIEMPSTSQEDRCTTPKTVRTPLTFDTPKSRKHPLSTEDSNESNPNIINFKNPTADFAISEPALIRSSHKKKTYGSSKFKENNAAKRKDDDVEIIETDDVVIDLCDDVKVNADAHSDDDLISVSETTVNTAQDPVSDKKETFSLTPDNISTICRTCLKQKDILNLYENKYEELTFAEILEMCSSTKLKDDTNLSQNICRTCCNELLQSYHFRLKCIKSEQTLASFKTELEKTKIRKQCAIERQKTISLRFHDYESILNEEDVLNITCTKRQESDDLSSITLQDVNNPSSVDGTNSSINANQKKRFYLIKGPLNSKSGVRLSEIDEENARNLIRDNTKKPMSMKVGNAVCNITKGTFQPGQADMVKGNLKSTLIRNKSMNKRKMLAYSQLIQPAIRSIMTGRFTSNSYLIKPKRQRRKRKQDPNALKNKDRKVIVPGVCETCNEPYNTMEEYNQHSRTTKHYLNPYICKLCGKVYPNKYRLKMHCNIKHEDSKSHMCEKCGKCYKTRGYLLVHLKTHSKTDYVCKDCGESFITLRHVVQHKRQAHHVREKKHCCEYCGGFFGRQDTLRHHRNRVHLKIKRQFCQICGKGYQYKSTLQKHMITHSTQQFDCSLCNKSFKADSRYLQHIKTQHPGTNERTKQEDEFQMFHCEYCDKSCRNKQLHSLHIAEDHGGNVCIYCDSLFDNAEILNEHSLRVHSEIPDFSCRYCGKCFTEARILYTHLDVHKARFYECHLCYKRFANNMRLKIHMVIHTREKLYDCLYCDKAFMYSSSRVIHERLHTGERPYVCEVCDKACVCISSYKKHRRTHILPVPERDAPNGGVSGRLNVNMVNKTVRGSLLDSGGSESVEMVPVFVEMDGDALETIAATETVLTTE